MSKLLSDLTAHSEAVIKQISGLKDKAEQDANFYRGAIEGVKVFMKELTTQLSVSESKDDTKDSKPERGTKKARLKTVKD